MCLAPSEPRESNHVRINAFIFVCPHVGQLFGLELGSDWFATAPKTTVNVLLFLLSRLEDLSGMQLALVQACEVSRAASKHRAKGGKKGKEGGKRGKKGKERERTKI